MPKNKRKEELCMHCATVISTKKNRKGTRTEKAEEGWHEDSRKSARLAYENRQKRGKRKGSMLDRMAEGERERQKPVIL